MENFIWTDCPQNPLVEPVFPDWMIADPCVLTPSQTPDGKWHMFANAIIKGVRHLVSDDGVKWKMLDDKLFIGIRPYVFLENGTYHLFYEKPASPKKSVIARRTSSDLKSWSEAVTALSPQYDWEGTFFRTNGNPCLIKHEGVYRLYYSASWIFLKDCLFFEPKYIGVAESDKIEGPYVKRDKPLISPSKDVYWRNFGAGSMKVIPPASQGEPWRAFNNGIYIDEKGRSRSEIHLLNSDDGYDWKIADDAPISAPTNEGWKRALVYAMHVVNYDGEWRMYYNSRDGWFIGKERIGMAVGKPR